LILECFERGNGFLPTLLRNAWFGADMREEKAAPHLNGKFVKKERSFFVFYGFYTQESTFSIDTQ